MIKNKQKTILRTCLSYEKYQNIKKEIILEYNEIARIGIIGKIPETNVGNIVVVTGGTSDISVAEEAVITAETLGNKVTKIYDVGIAGIHRLLSNSDIWLTLSLFIALILSIKQELFCGFSLLYICHKFTYLIIFLFISLKNFYFSA